MNNQNDVSEDEFLENYDAGVFRGPLVTVDAALFTYHEGAIKVLAVKRSQHPDIGKWGLPGGFISLGDDRDLNDTVMRMLRDKTGVAPPYIEQIGAFGDHRRDKRGWSLTVCYTALIAHQNCKTYVEGVEDVQWVSLETFLNRKLAFDHKRLVKEAKERLRQKALYSVVPAFALPDKFTLPELQALHEALVEKPLPKKSFRRRIEQAKLIENTGEKRTERGRPAALYRVREEARKFTFLRNLEA